MNDRDYCHRILRALKEARDNLLEAAEQAENLENPKHHPIVQDVKIVGYYTLQGEIESAVLTVESLIEDADKELLR